jgi:hypothetical protein
VLSVLLKRLFPAERFIYSLEAFYAVIEVGVITQGRRFDPAPATKILSNSMDLERNGKIEIGRVVVKLLYFFSRILSRPLEDIQNAQIP